MRSALTTPNKKRFTCRTSLYLVALLITHQAAADTFAVSNINASGAGSFSAALAGAASGGSNRDDAFLYGVGIPGSSIVLTGNTAPVNKSAGQNLDMSNSGALITINGGANQILNVSGGGFFNAGGLKFQGTNASGVLVSGGSTLRMTGSDALATGMSLDNATFQGFNGFSTTNNISIAGQAQFETDASGMTLAGAIGGSGGIVKKGAGTMTLMGGANSYLGGTQINAGVLSIINNAQLGAANTGIVFDGGTLQVRDSILIDRNIELLSGGGKVEMPSFVSNVTLNGLISGNGKLSLSGFSNVTLGNIGNSYSGGTDLDGCSLLLSNAATLGTGKLSMNNSTIGIYGTALTITQDIETRGMATINDSGSNIVLTGNLSGNGDLLFVLGQTTLTGKNLITGLTRVDGGKLIVGSADNIGNGGLALNGATLKTIANLISSSALHIAGGSTIDTNGNDVIFNGNFSNSIPFANLIKAGNGTLSLNGVGAYNGDITVNQGTLEILGRQTLRFGAVSNTGRLRATSLAASSYIGNGTLETTLASGITNLDVTGIANLTNGKLVITGSPQQGQYTVVNAGTLTGQFESITIGAGKAYTETYEGNRLLLDIRNLSTLGQNTSINSTNSELARLLDNAAGNATGDLDDVITHLNRLSAEDQARALGQMSPLSYAAMDEMSFAATQSHLSAVSDRMSNLRLGDAANRFAAFSGRAHPTFLVADGPADVGPTYFSDENRTATKWGAFASVLGSSGKKNDKNSHQPGYDFSQGGTAVGLDYRITENVSGGVSLGYMTGSAHVNENGGSSDLKSLRYGFYGTGHRGDFFTSVYAGGASNAYETERNVISLGRTAKAKPDGKELNLAAQVGYNVKTKPAAVAVIGGLGYDRLKIDEFTETGAGVLNLTVKNQTVASFHSNLGINVSKPIQKTRMSFTPYVSAAWLHEFGNRSRDVTAQLSSVGSFATKVADVNRDGALAGLGFLAAWSKRWSASVGYQGEFRSDFTNHGINGTLRLGF